MGVDIYMEWEKQTKQEHDDQITGYATIGAKGYLRGAYFGGLSDCLRFLFDWADWDKEFDFDPKRFKTNLEKLKEMEARPGSGSWDHTKGAKKGWDFTYHRQEMKLSKENIQEYENFLELGEKLIKEHKKPKINISY